MPKDYIFGPSVKDRKWIIRQKLTRLFKLSIFYLKIVSNLRKVARIRIVQRTVVQFADFFNKLPRLLYHMLSLSVDWENT